MWGVGVEYEVGMYIIVERMVCTGQEIWRDAHTVVQSSKKGGSAPGDGSSGLNLLGSLIITLGDISVHI